MTGQAELLEPYVERYLQMAETIIEDKGVWIGQNALIALFPSANPSADNLAKVDAWLATTETGPASRRYVSEGRDDLARALRAQAASQAEWRRLEPAVVGQILAGRGRNIVASRAVSTANREISTIKPSVPPPKTAGCPGCCGTPPPASRR